MKVVYNKEVDVLMFYLNDNVVADSDEESAGVIMDYDASGNIIAIEILDASKRVDDLGSMHFITSLSEHSARPTT